MSESPVTFKFDKMSPVAALRLLADVDGKQAVFHGHSVRFDMKAATSKVGFTLENADALSERQVSFKFDKVSPVSALKMLAGIDGNRAVFDGRRVRFDPK